ncbi:MAG: group 1 glycosyl transferase, partial [Thermodesulfobacteriota bacterium]|nr:group 1 glycosyl transferase [Thermodesulfobacteriota bacterium]
MRTLLFKVLRYGKHHGFLALTRLLATLFVNSIRLLLPFPITQQRTDLENILIVSHEASRTGAPILALNLVRQLVGRYNVFVLLLGTGPLCDDFRRVGAIVIIAPYLRAANCLCAGQIKYLSNRFKFKYALVNSIESCAVLPALSRHQIPTISLIHEFASY